MNNSVLKYTKNGHRPRGKFQLMTMITKDLTTMITKDEHSTGVIGTATVS